MYVNGILALPDILTLTVPSGNTMQVFAGHSGPVQCGEFTPDGKSEGLEPKKYHSLFVH